ncbi:MAG: hypothetical protein G01um101433_782 [Parcubacteria group bacterium Gr01-1014_33]|nr:MAG: hypothetical protein G01um101433_782 [Parcubacteria group bacterium Gr01-1014_33]
MNSCVHSWICVLHSYQLLFVIPGISPLFASSRKHMRQSINVRRYPRFRPHRKHRRTTRDLYFGFFSARAITDCFAINVMLIYESYANLQISNEIIFSLFAIRQIRISFVDWHHCFIGNPINFNNSIPSSRFRAVVTTVTSNPNKKR